MAKPHMAGMSRGDIIRLTRDSAEAAVTAAAPDIAATGAGHIRIGTLRVRVPHNATASDLAEAVRVAIGRSVR